MPEVTNTAVGTALAVKVTVLLIVVVPQLELESTTLNCLPL
jgi:hypothetical protein